MSVVQLTIDLNEIIQKLAQIIADGANYSTDFKKYASLLKQDVGRAEFLVAVANRRLLGSPTVQLGTVQREAIEITFNDLKGSHQELKEFLTSSHGPEFNPISIAVTSNASLKSVMGTTTRRIQWVMGRKSMAQKILDDVRRSNNFLWTSLQDLELLCPTQDSEALPVPENVAGISAHRVLSAQRTRLGIRRGRIPLNKNILRHRQFLDTSNGSLLESGSSVRTAVFAGSRVVLVEGYQIGDDGEASERRAIQLAMLLSQPKVTGFGVFRCDGLVHDASNRRYEFIFELGSVATDLKDDGLPFATTKESLSSLHSLHYHLSSHPYGPGNGPGNQLPTVCDTSNCRVFRFTKPGDELSFRPLSVLERLVFARSLAQTLNTLHLAEWVHGNITSRSILFFQDVNRQPSARSDIAAPSGKPSIARLSRPYLFGFQFTRLESEYSGSWGRDRLESWNNSYRHPERQVHRDRVPLVRHLPLHDMYSLGVIFLEIGLGELAENLIVTGKCSLLRLSTAAPTALSTTPEQSDAAVTTAPNLHSPTQHITSQDIFLHLADWYLPERMGEAFAYITRQCISGEFRIATDNESREGASQLEIRAEEMTLSTIFGISIIEPLDRLIRATSLE